MTCYRFWVQAFPSNAGRPTDAELYQLAGRFPLREFSIRTLVEEAVKRAKMEQGNNGTSRVSVTQRDRVLAVARRYHGLGLAVTRQAFGEEFYVWVEEAGLILLRTTSAERSYRFWRGMFAANIARPTQSQLRTLAKRFPFERSHIQEIVLNVQRCGADRGAQRRGRHDQGDDTPPGACHCR